MPFYLSLQSLSEFTNSKIVALSRCVAAWFQNNASGFAMFFHIVMENSINKLLPILCENAELFVIAVAKVVTKTSVIEVERHTSTSSWSRATVS